MDTRDQIRLSAYLQRIGLPSAPDRTLVGVAELQEAHRLAIGFENFDVRLGRPILIDSDAVFDKLVGRGRGGYCFEQNRLLADVLTALGIPNRPLLGRVRLGTGDGITPPRTHVCLLAEVEGGQVICDAGFGGSNVPPLPLVDGAEASTGDGARHRLRRVGSAGALTGEWLLERAGPPAATDGRGAPHSDWQAQYSFDLAEVAPDDLQQANHWTSTRPGTRFTSLHIASIPLPDGFARLTDRSFAVTQGDAADSREIAGPEEYREVLAEVFKIRMSDEEVAALPLFRR